MIPSQAICAVCGENVRPGKGIVNECGAGGRVHAVQCEVRPKRVRSAAQIASLASARDAQRRAASLKPNALLPSDGI
jgi:hypothetical protein